MMTVSKFRYALLISVIAVFIQGNRTQVLAVVPICDDVCYTTPPPDCGTGCYVDMEAYDNGSETDCNTYTDGGSCCGDGLCDLDEEEMGNCPEDCGTVTDVCGQCNPETQTGCSAGQVCSAEECCMNVPDCGECGCANCSEPPPNDCTDNQCYTNSDCCTGNACLWSSSYGSQGVCVSGSY